MEVPQEGDMHSSPLENRAPAGEAHALWPLTMAQQPTAFQTFAIPHSTNIAIMARAEDDHCTEKPDDPMCQKSMTAGSMTLPLVLGIVIPLLGAIIALLFLHRRHVKKQKLEDINDPHASLDFGLGNGGGNKWNKQRTAGQADLNDGLDLQKEKSHKHGMSFDMMSPYILPATNNQSTNSLQSLSRNLKESDDPYGPVNTMGSDAVSVRSFGGRKDNASVYTSKTGHSQGPTSGLVGNASSMGMTSHQFNPPPRSASMAQQNSPALSPIGISPIEPAYFPDQASGAKDNSMLAPGAVPEPRDSYAGQDASELRLSNNYLGSYIAPGDMSPKSAARARAEQNSPFADSARMPEDSRGAASRSPSPPPAFMMPTGTPPRGDSLQQNAPGGPLPQIPVIGQIPTIADPVEWKEDQYEENDSFYVTPPSPKDDFAKKAAKRASRYSMDVPPEEYAKAGLGAPGVNPQRVSMGFRPLPPANLLAAESDDPEIRANRIRSFYKEYFDDSKPAPAGQYYEDFDDGAYHDTLPNSHTMPYNEPVQRRAMTPPPGAGRFMGQQHPPRSQHGSLSSSNMGPPSFRAPGGPGGPRGPFRGPDSRATSRNGSMTSSAAGWRGPPGFANEPRASSSASNLPHSRPGTQQSSRQLPPPEDLRTMPTPSMLKDDSFGLLNAHEFAPPTTYAERNRGRSQSPMGERKAYQINVPAANQLLSTFDEMPVIPSPHLLRKSGTFTSLDFAPPKRVFKDQDTMSDAGSIRSNRSGVSNVALQAIRAGANRISRLPQNEVMTKDSMADVLKPKWGGDQRT